MIVREIRRLDDKLLLPWLELYETAFPPEERNLVADILRAVTPGAAAYDRQRLLAATDGAAGLIGMAMYDLTLPGAAAVMWYLATVPAARNQGRGALLYREVERRVREAGARVLFLEVEIPERAAGQAQAALAVRRLAFYARLGCRRLAGIDYLQYVGPHQAPIPMYVLAQPLEPMATAELFSLAQATFGDWLRPAGEPSLA